MFDWYITWQQLEQYVRHLLGEERKEARVLVVGCGNSSSEL